MAKGKYRPWREDDGLLRIEGWARDGLTDAQIAEKIGISQSTFYDWCARYPEISESIKRGKAPVDTLVENMLLQRATGYDTEEITEERRFDPATGSFAMVVTKRVKKRVVPDVTAQIFWLKNRKPSRWRDKPEAEGDDNDQVRQFIEAMKHDKPDR